MYFNSVKKKSSEFVQQKKKETKEEAGDSRHEKFSTHWCWFEEGESSMARNAGGHKEQREAPGWQPARKQKPQHYNLEDLNSTNNSDKPEWVHHKSL